MARRLHISFIWATKMDTRHNIRCEIRSTQYARQSSGSAIILAVVLTSLLAIVGAIFLLSSRVDSIATSAIADNEDLNLAVDTVISQISEVLADDVPQVDANGAYIQEYYDYPDPCFNPWLACLEPYLDTKGTASVADDTYNWQQVSDIYGNLYPASQNMYAGVIPDYNDNFRVYTAADADGDGVGDSIWVPVLGKTSSKGKTVYAAVRIVDNSAMLNVNTGYKFDPCTADGSSQMQINLAGLSDRGSTTNPLGKLRDYRCGLADANYYEQNVIWQYGNPVGAYTPFDVSDELKFRNRYLLLGYNNPFRTRVGNLWDYAFNVGLQVPVTSISDPCDWFWRTNNLSSNPKVYDYRHIATTQNLDRIIAPDGERMLNINRDSLLDPSSTRDRIAAALVAGGVPAADADANAAQITANLIDYVDGPDYVISDPGYDPHNDVTVVYDKANNEHFGFERPVIYISEIVQSFYSPIGDPNIYSSYAVELHKPYPEDLPPFSNEPNEWRLRITGSRFEYIYFWWTGSSQFNVLLNDEVRKVPYDLNSPVTTIPTPFNGEIGVKQDVTLQWTPTASATSYNVYLGTSQPEVYLATTSDANVFLGNVSATTFTPGTLDPNTTYYWRIDPNGPGLDAKGFVWWFRVSEIRPFYSSIEFVGKDYIWLQRKVPALGPDEYVTVDAVQFPAADPNTGWLTEPTDPNVRFAVFSYQRNIMPNMPMRRLWDGFLTQANISTLGQYNGFVAGTGGIQSHPANRPFTNVGEIGQVFYAPTYDYGGKGADFSISPDESQMRINLADSGFQPLFNYLTLFDPINYDYDANETRIKGRININTAPWFVLAQLPWVSYHTPGYDLARKIVNYRDKTNGYDYRLGLPGFRNIGELMADANSSPDNIGFYADQAVVPSVLMTPEDGTGDIFDRRDVFEQRDAIFARISNLVTVRSDVFTAYILIRIGKDGPLKRVVAILDRSDVTRTGGKVKVIAIQQVPDPR